MGREFARVLDDGEGGVVATLAKVESEVEVLELMVAHIAWPYRSSGWMDSLKALRTISGWKKPRLVSMKAHSNS